MNIDYSFIDVYDPLDLKTKQFCKLAFPANEKSMLHRWNPPIKTIYNVQHCNNEEYFIQDKNSSTSFINSLQSLMKSKLIVKELIAREIFTDTDLKHNYAYNIFDTNLGCVFEARIISCFCNSKEEHSLENIYWDLFIDHINVHFYVNTLILKRLMNSVYISTLLSFNINHKIHKRQSTIHLNLFIPRKSTILLTINRETLQKKFTYNNNVLELQKPSLTSNALVFDNKPYHIGDGIILSKQDPCFLNESNQNILKLHRKKKNRILQCRLIVICNKNEIDSVVNHPSSSLHLNFISVSDQSKNDKVYKDDEYVILLIATNPKKSDYSTKTYPQFDKDITTMIHKTRNPNVSSNKGEKHNSTYGKYYGFGIINNYKIENGISFGKFGNNKVNNDLHETNIENIRNQFLFAIQRLNSVIKANIVHAGNDQINSLISFGRLSTIHQRFIDVTESSQFMLEKCFSMWLCENGRTEEFHQEIDVSYTLIGIPINLDKEYEKANGSYKFQFRWNQIEDRSSLGLDIGLYDGICLYYNGIGLFHRQVPCSMDYNNQNFWNLSMYHNYRLYNNISKSINRYKE